jgi:hypothetical protein
MVFENEEGVLRIAFFCSFIQSTLFTDLRTSDGDCTEGRTAALLSVISRSIVKVTHRLKVFQYWTIQDKVPSLVSSKDVILLCQISLLLLCRFFGLNNICREKHT